jgi:hypothetical protein
MIPLTCHGILPQCHFIPSFCNMPSFKGFIPPLFLLLHVPLKQASISCSHIYDECGLVHCLFGHVIKSFCIIS